MYIYNIYIYQAILGPSFRAFEFDSSFLLCIFGMSHPPQLSFHRAIMLACMLGFPTQNGSFPMGTSNFVEDVSLSVKLERLKHHLLHPGAPGYIHQLSTKKVNAMQWQQMSAQWAAMMQVSRWLKSEAEGCFCEVFEDLQLRFYVELFFDM